MKKSTIIIIIVLILIVGYFLIKGNLLDNISIPSNVGVLELRITDPTNTGITSLILNISEVRIHYTGNENISAGWISVKEEPILFDLIQLSKTPISQFY